MVGAKQLLLRGSRLKNTKWIVGLVTYTGVDTVNIILFINPIF
jgi:hypothetical protein